jgi:formyltetrahydrofolate deformylase
MRDSAVLFIDSPDRKGLVARVSGLLYETGGNSLHVGHHRDHELGRFFMRVEDQVGDLWRGGGTWSA